MSKRLTVHNGETPVYDIVIENSYNSFGEEMSKLNIEIESFVLLQNLLLVQYMPMK